MIIYKDEQDVIDSVQQYIERELVIARRIQDNHKDSPRSRDYIEAVARAGALQSVRYLLTDYVIRPESVVFEPTSAE